MRDENDVMNPVGAIARRGTKPRERTHERGRTVVGLLDNSKPNVAIFLDAVQAELRREGEYDFVSCTKPRSAAPSPDLESLASRCDVVINAVAD